MRVIVRCQESCDGVRGQLWPVDACQGNVSAPSEATDGPRRLATCDLRLAVKACLAFGFGWCIA
jgi:hypothetical protein